jgi:hypothetical protein
MVSKRISSNSVTGVAPVTIYPDSPDALFLDSSKYRMASNLKIYQYNSSNFININDTYDKNDETDEIIEPADAPHLQDIILLENELYLDASGKARVRVVFKINNPDIDNISDVIVAHQMTKSESGK